MVVAEATVYVWFCARSAKMQVNFGTQASHSGTEYFFKAKILKIFFYLIACIESRTLRNTCTVVGAISSLQSAQAHLLCHTGDYKYLSSIDEEAKQ